MVGGMYNEGACGDCAHEDDMEGSVVVLLDTYVCSIVYSIHSGAHCDYDGVCLIILYGV